MRHFLFLVSLLLIVACIYGCRYMPQKAFYLEKVSFTSLPGWYDDNLKEAIPAMQRNCQVMKTKKEWQNFCKEIEQLKTASSKTIRKFIEQNMIPYAVYANGSDEGTFTGYYEASLSGSLSQDEVNNYPIYGLPADLISLDTKTVCSSGCDAGTMTGRIEKGRFIPTYYTRQDIHQKKINAPVLFWVSDPVDAFILHVQGSGRIQTENGVFHVGYAGNNGHDFLGIGAIMAKEGLLEQGKSSMPDIKEWLKKNPQKAQQLMNQNPRYIFFKILDGKDGPIGAMGVPLTAKRSLAVDPDFIPLGSLLYLDTKAPDGKELRRLVIAQDKGSAIKGAVRGDFFWGYGDDAFQNAGRMKSPGKYYLLYPKDVKVESISDE